MVKTRIELTDEVIVHFHKMGTRVGKNTLRFHNVYNKDYTYLTVDESRGKIGMDASGVIPDFGERTVRDVGAPIGAIVR